MLEENINICIFFESTVYLFYMVSIANYIKSCYLVTQLFTENMFIACLDVQVYFFFFLPILLFNLFCTISINTTFFG